MPFYYNNEEYKAIYKGVSAAAAWLEGNLSGDIDLSGSSLTAIQNSAFAGMTEITSVKLPNGLLTIPYHCFYGCTGLTSVTIPSSLTEVNAEAFYGCTRLTSLTLPSSLTTIGDSFLRDCTSLTSLTIDSTTPPNVSTTYFMRNVPTDCAIYVPAESVSAYQSATGWSDRAAYIQAIPVE